ncbi:MAG: HAMP domain-containing sensor histidine kinase [Clostridiaceae bacterium]|nr:cell wall metabolism sensor histidine kinase WalK [Eubacteriales bacterium]
MFKTLFSRMLFTYLAATLLLLALLGVTVSGMFQSQYIEEKEAELTREAEEINSIVAQKYIDSDKRPVAREELFTIARKYDALIQLRFLDAALGKVTFMDEGSAAKWAGGVDEDFSAAAEEAASSGASIRTDLFKELLSIPVMSLVRPLAGSNGEVLGTLFLHVDMSAVNLSIRQVYLDVLLSSCVAVMLAFLTVSYITGRITKPIAEMNDVVRRFSKGEYELRSKVAGADEVAELSKSFNNMADEINTLEQARRSFVANVSHELRSPLTSMRGFLEAMQDGTIPLEEHAKYLAIVMGENNRMTGMVNDLLDLARMESGQYVLKLRQFDINELIIRTLLTFEARVNAKGIEVEMDFEEEKSPVEADPDQIAQVLRNLVDNAVKFTPQGGKLSVLTSVDKRVVTVCVRDSGCGMSEEDAAHVFERFYKAEKAHTPSDTSGTGLGLSIVKRILDAHAQNISVISSPGAGASFCFTLKRAADKKSKTGAEKH